MSEPRMDIVPVPHTGGELAALISPEATLAAGHKAAVSLKRMIDETGSKVRIGTSDHIKVEAWQTVGSFFHVTTKTDAEPCEIDGIKGAKGNAVLIDDLSGQVVGGAEAYCMRDEDGRAAMPWFKIASMAQTRAASKALANKFKWITVMAGYSPTPAEEMEGEQAASHKKKDEPVTFESAKAITEIREMLSKMNSADDELISRQLKVLTTWKPKGSTEEKWLTLDDLASISRHKPDWLKGIHKKVKDEFDKAFDAEGRPK